MAVLEKIRVKFGIVITAVIAIALLSFIIDPATLDSAVNSMSSKYDVGNISGKKISYQEFQESINKFTVINELLSGTSSQDEQTQIQIRNAAWQELLDKYMFIKNAQAAGIKVGKDEVSDLFVGDNVSPLIAQNSAFVDETGAFSPEAVKLFVDQIDMDESGRLRIYWNYLQNAVQTQQYYQKYGALFAASNIENALQLKDDLKANNTTADVKYSLSMYPIVQDSTITVSSNEIKQFYNENKKLFKQNASREIEYVVFEVVPSADDEAAAKAEMDAAYAEFSKADNLKNFLLRNSERQLSEFWYKKGELNTISTEINDQIFGGEDLSEIVKSGESFLAARTVETKMLPDSVFVKHILLQGEGAENTADSLVNVIKKGGNFSNLAAVYSADQSAYADGELGSIGWMTQTYMIPGFESVIEAKVNQPFVLNTIYGSHVVLVTEKTKPVEKKQVAILEKSIVPSKETYGDYYAQANTFASLTDGSYEGYKAALDSTKIYSHNVTITEATSTYGTIERSKEVTRWAFDNKVGKASNIITVDNNYFFIATVKKINKEGFAPVEDVAYMIRERLYQDKLQSKMMAEVSEKIKGAESIEAAAEALGLTVDTNEGLSLAATTVDPALTGAAMVAEEGKVYGPVAGGMGVYVVSVSNRQEGAFYTEEDAKSLASQKAQYMSQLIVPVMSESENVVDNRERFF